MQALVGPRIKARREALGLKQAELARSAGISPSYLNLIEHNRRRIGGKVLLGIAAVLEVAPSILSEGAETALVQSLQKSAAIAKSEVEVGRVEEMVGRFPGWARHLAVLQDDVARLERDLERLNDRLTHDPFLSESLHDILSNVTAIHATASILTDVPDIEAAQQSRFLRNLHSESLRLSSTSQALVSYFDRQPDTLNSPSTPFDEFELFLAENAYHFADIETAKEGAIGQILEATQTLPGPAAQRLAHEFLVRYENEARLLPEQAFLRKAHALDFKPDLLAQAFRCDLPMIFRRLAFLPPQVLDNEQKLEFGLIACDISGAVTLRKPLAGFPLPRYGSACPIWPLYQSFAQPGVPIMACLNTPGGADFLSYGHCQRIGQAGFNQPQQLQASMLITPMVSQTVTTKIQVGLNCRICPRNKCASRREPTIIEPPK